MDLESIKQGFSTEEINDLVKDYLAKIANSKDPEDSSLEAKDIRNAERKAKVDKVKADRLLRDKYAFKAYKIVKKSLWGWAILLAIYGFVKFLTRNDNNGHGFEIFSDTLLIAITSATTLNIFAAFLSLVKGLFPSEKSND